jgi:putative DNA primase/helicase
VLDSYGKPINKDCEDFIKFESLKKKINAVKIPKQGYSVLVIKVFKKKIVNLDFALKVFNKEIFFYNTKYWQNITEERFTSFLSDVADKMGLTELIYEHHSFGNDLIKQFTHKNFSQDLPIGNYTLINLQNGTYKFLNGKGRIHKHNKSDNLHYVLPFDYDPKATCPKFIEYLDYCLPDKEKSKVLQEYLGYVFTPNNVLNLEKCILLYGEGGNGKSVLYNVINALLGKENISSYSIPQLTDRQKGEYYIVHLQNKLLNYCSDTKGAFEDTGVFKQLVSGEKVTGRHPAGRPVEFQNNTKFIFNVNILPSTPENIHGFFRRFEIIDFNITIEEGKKDRQLATKIIDEELSGVFNWMLEGLNRLLKNKNLTYCKANKDALEKFKIKSNNVLEFLMDEGYEVVTNIELGDVLSDVFLNYQTWIAVNGGRALKKSSFKERVDSSKLRGEQLYRDEKCNGNRHRVNITRRL